MSGNEEAHVPVLSVETLEALKIKPGGVYVDCTLGGGGHSSKIYSELDGGRLIGIDRDPRALEKAKERFPEAGGFEFVKGNFRYLAQIWKEREYPAVDGFLFDLGISSMQLDDPGAGFSFRAGGPLDMRFDPEEGETAEEIVTRWSDDELAELFRSYGERGAERIARGIVKERERKEIGTTDRLAEVVAKAAGGRRGKIHPATKVFLALRAEVNGELEAIREGIPAAIERLKPGGRIVAITYHSGEDRIVKDIFRRAAKGCSCERAYDECECEGESRISLVNKKVIRPERKETLENKRARSAKMRVAERKKI